MNSRISRDLAKHRIQQAKEDLIASKALYDLKLYKSANNRAYYSIFHSIRSVLSLEPIDFKRHKSVIAYFNQNYINTEKFPKSMGKRIVQASKTREDSDYDDEFIVKAEDTLEQIETAEELMKLVEEYIQKDRKEE